MCVGQMFSLVSNTKVQLYTDNEIKLKKKKAGGEYILYTDHFISFKQYFPKSNHFQLEKNKIALLERSPELFPSFFF